MIDELIKDINELMNYKKMYESQKKDKARMSEMLFELMTEKYKSTSYEERVLQYKMDRCRCCKYRDCCQIELPEDILKPKASESEWIPPLTSCGEFEWS